MLVLSFSHGDSALLALLLATGLLLLAVSQFVRIPYPIVLVLGGAVIGFIPGAPEVHLNPDLVLVAVLPPLLYGGAFFTSLRELRANMKAIGFLAIGLVLVTMLAVAAVAHEFIAGLDWPEAFVLGALVSPTDPTASSAIAERLGLPTRLVSLIEGESLVNDGTALVAYRFAVAAVVTGSFSLFDASWHFVLQRRRRDRRRARRRLPDPPAAQAARQPAGRDRDRPAERLPRLPPGAGARRLRGARGGHGRDLPRLAHAGADDRADPPAGTGGLGDRLPAPERAAVRAGRAAAADDSRRDLGPARRRS